jgi:hypothetical protein
MQRNKERNRAAVIQNSGSNFVQPRDPDEKKDEMLIGEFKKSGLVVRGDDLSRELFVVDRKTAFFS